MQKTMKINRLVVAMGVIGSMGLAANSAVAADFDVSSEVLNTLAVTVDTPMNLGTIFAVDASDATVSSLVLGTGDGITDGVSGTGVTMLSLGGATAARGSVDPSDNNFNVIPPALTIDTSDGTTAHGELDTAVGNDEAVEVSINTGNTGVASFYLANFTIGTVTDGELVGTNTAGSPQEISPDFGAAATSFGIGAEIFTDPAGGTYQNGTYEGTFSLTAEFL